MPSHLLQGVIPSVLFEKYRFFQDETSKNDLRANGRRVYRGYPKDDATTTVVIVSLGPLGNWENAGHRVASPVYETTGLPGRTVQVLRKTKLGLTSTVQRLRRIASTIEKCNVLARKRQAKKTQELNLEDAQDDDEETAETFATNETVLAWDAGGKPNPRQGNGQLTEPRWAVATVTALLPPKSFSVYINDTGQTMKIKAHHIRKLSPELAANPQRAMGLGIWEYDDMSEEEDLDWASSSEEDEEPLEDSEEVDQRKSKQSLNFDEFWNVPAILAAAGGNESVCAALLRRLAATKQSFRNMEALAAAVRADCSADGEAHLEEENSDDTTESSGRRSEHDIVDEETKVLLNLLYAPRRSRLHSVAKTLARLENLSHILAWTACAPDGPGVADLEGPLARERKHATRGCPPLELIELPRLKLSFTSRHDEDGRLQLFSLDHANLFVSNLRDHRAVKLIAGIPHSLLMATSQGEMSILVSVWKVARPAVTTMPFSSECKRSFCKLPLLCIASSLPFVQFSLPLSLWLTEDRCL